MSNHSEELAKLTTKKENLEKEYFNVKIESTTLTEVNKKMAEKINKIEQVLKSKQESIWQTKIKFCVESQKYHDQYGIGSTIWNKSKMAINDPNLHISAKTRKILAIQNEKISNDISNLEKEIINHTVEIEMLSEKLLQDKKEISDLMIIRDKLMEEPNGGGFESLKEFIVTEEEKCQRLEYQLQEKENLISRSKFTMRKNNDI